MDNAPVPLGRVVTMEQMLINLMEAVSLAIQRAKLWRLPPNWNERQWNDELRSIAWSSAWEAYHTFDPERNIPLQVFVFLRVKKALWDFYRREWEYACHHISPPQTEGDEESENWEFALLSLQREGKEWQRMVIHLALSQLSERERFVIEQLFWDGWTEAEIVQELGISQQMVSKIKGKALRKLREMLNGLLF